MKKNKKYQSILLVITWVGTMLLPCTSFAQISPSTDKNHVVEYTVERAGITTTSQAKTLPQKELNVSISYFDGLGRPLQNIQVGASPSGKDIVNTTVYDQFGREEYRYLPYVSSQNNGAFKANVFGSSSYQGSTHYNYYHNGTTDMVEDDDRPFSVTEFESSPLSRPLKVYGPGKQWGPAESNKFTAYQYTLNQHGTGTGKEKLIAWKVDNAGMPVRFSPVSTIVETGGYYSSNQLKVTVSTDENGNTVREYTDKANKVVLKKVQAGSSTNLNDFTTWALTYYIYDERGNLRYVLQPELSKLMHANDQNVPASGQLSSLAFQYNYDSRNRMFMKKVPGADPIYMVYDNRDRLVMTQDGNQRLKSPKEWTFTKYDAFNRPVITGITTDNSAHDVVQQNVNTFYSNLTSGKAWFDAYTGTGSFYGYDNKSYPQVTSSASFLTVTYYDRYDANIAPSTYGPVNQGLPGETTGNQNLIRGQVTASLVKDLSTNSMMRTVNYYDDKYRLIQSVGDHQKGTARVSNVYDFVGKALFTKRSYSVNTGATTQNTSIKETFTYDHAGRLLVTKHSINGAPDVVVSVNYYNELGQLISKGLHSDFNPPVDNAIGQPGTAHAATLTRAAYSTSETKLIATTSIKLTPGYHVPQGSTLTARIGFTEEEAATAMKGKFRQTIDYRYNIRGWLTRVNNANINTLADGNNTLDHFGMELNYEKPVTGLTTTPQYNGNISAIRWSKGASNANDQQAYTFTYDQMNRLKDANHFDQLFTASTWAGNNNAFGESISSYDLNGNINALTRRGLAGTTIDVLGYTYSGNQLSYVNDTVTQPAEGFVNGNTGTDDYSYDANGNLIKDKNKGLNNNGDISYNYLNLPKEVIKGSERIRYGYDAAGRKLFQEVYSSSGTVLEKRTDYIGELIYEGKTTADLQFINHTEGRVLPDGNGWEYQYHLKDHLGNVRVTFTTKPDTETTKATLEDENISAEEASFLRLENARRVYHHLFDRSKGTSPTKIDGYAQRLSGGQNERYGLARSISVMPGDKINAEVYAKYSDGSSSNSDFTALLNNIATAIATGATSSGRVIDNGGFSNSTVSFNFVSEGTQIKSTDNETGPKAYLNWLVFDRNYNLILSKSGFDRLSSTPKETGDDVAHERLFSPEITIEKAGFVYIYLSNEEGTPLDVYFDDFLVTHIQSPVQQMDDYYPFGLAFNSYSRENSVLNQYKYNGKELISELGLNDYDYGARQYDPAIGRWKVQDRKAELYYGTSPSAYALNQPTNAIDPDGNIVIFINGNHFGDGATGYQNWRKGSSSYNWRGTNAYWNQGNQSFDGAVMSQLGDHNAIYRDGAANGYFGFMSDNPMAALSPYRRSSEGYSQGKSDAKMIIESLARDKNGNIVESIKIITHSMGGAYGKGYLKAIKDYIKTLPKEQQRQIMITLVADFDPFQAGSLEADPDVFTQQFTHKKGEGRKDSDGMGWLANNQQDGADEYHEDGGEAAHSIFTFFNNIQNMQEGTYKWNGNAWECTTCK